MGHAIHFLERLKRVDDAHIEQVLSLYYSSKRTRTVIDLALNDFLTEEDRRAVESERVALALDDSDAPPYLIATRAGQMVTCLAPGMLPYGLRVVSGSALESACGRYDDMKSRTDDYLKLKQREGSKKHGNIFNPIFDQAWALPRSTMRGLSFLHPWLSLDAFRRAVKIASLLDLDRDDLTKLVRRAQVSHDTQRWVSVNDQSQMKSHLRQRYDKPLNQYWKNAWAMTHLMVLSVCENAEYVSAWVSSDQVLDYAFQQKSIYEPRLIAWSALRQGSLPMTLRGIWVNAQLEEHCLDGAERCVGKHITAIGILNHLMPICVIALKENHLRQRALNLLREAALSNLFSTDPYCQYYQSLANFLHQFAENPKTDNLEDGISQHGRNFYEYLSKHAKSAGHPTPCSVADLPLNVALTFGSFYPVVTHSPGMGAYDQLPFYLHWLARAKAEDFYAPDEFAPLLRV